MLFAKKELFTEKVLFTKKEFLADLIAASSPKVNVFSDFVFFLAFKGL